MNLFEQQFDSTIACHTIISPALVNILRIRFFCCVCTKLSLFIICIGYKLSLLLANKWINLNKLKESCKTS